MNFNRPTRSQMQEQEYVSIPNRDFDELQFESAIKTKRPIPVSIPNRDFDELQSGC